MADGTKKSQIPPGEEGEEEYYYEEVLSQDASSQGSQMPGSQMPGSQMPGSQMPGSQTPGSQTPGSQAAYGSQAVYGSQMPGSQAEGSQYEYVEYSQEEPSGSQAGSAMVPKLSKKSKSKSAKSAQIKVIIRSNEGQTIYAGAPLGSTGVRTTAIMQGAEPVTAPRIKRRKKGEKATLSDCRIGFVGAGKLSEYIVKGLINITQVDPKRIFVANRSGRNHDTFQRLGCSCTKRNYDIFGRMDCDVVFLTFHGFVIKNLYRTGGTRPMALTTNYIPNQRHPIYILTLVGGCTVEEIKPTLLNPDNPNKYRLEMHRIVLNYPVSVGLGLGAIDVEPDSKKCGSLVRDLLTSFSKIEYFPEASMDVICCLGGNGLPFVFYFLAALSDGAFKMGLPKAQGDKIAAKTLASAAASLLESGKHPSDLRDACTSPSGPAIYGLHVLDKLDCSSAVSMAVEAAFHRLKELADREN